MVGWAAETTRLWTASKLHDVFAGCVCKGLANVFSTECLDERQEQRMLHAFIWMRIVGQQNEWRDNLKRMPTKFGCVGSLQM